MNHRNGDNSTQFPRVKHTEAFVIVLTNAIVPEWEQIQIHSL